MTLRARSPDDADRRPQELHGSKLAESGSRQIQIQNHADLE
jgi:hypothetical protein